MSRLPRKESENFLVQSVEEEPEELLGILLVALSHEAESLNLGERIVHAVWNECQAALRGGAVEEVVSVAVGRRGGKLAEKVDHSVNERVRLALEVGGDKAGEEGEEPVEARSEDEDLEDLDGSIESMTKVGA